MDVAPRGEMEVLRVLRTRLQETRDRGVVHEHVEMPVGCG